MSKKKIHLGETAEKLNDAGVNGCYVTINGERFYKIENMDRMPAFFMSIVSDSDHWIFISSKGSLTAGRKNAENALFPYYTVDKIHDSHEITGSKTIILVKRKGKRFLWEPFSERYEGLYRIKRNIYKNICGNKLIFEEVNEDLSLIFQYGWFTGETYGFIKKSRVINNSKTSVSLICLDGIQNILPYGVNKSLQAEFSTLVDAYKKNELHAETGLGIYRLSSIPVDKAEPSEALRVTTVWSEGVRKSKILISSRQLDQFRRGRSVQQENDIRAERGAYFIVNDMKMTPRAEKVWYIVAEVNQDAGDVASLIDMLKNQKNLPQSIEKDIDRGTENLVKMVINADGLQVTKDELSCARHFANVLFNIMRGGIFDDNYSVEKEDFITFLKQTNSRQADKHPAFVNGLPDRIILSDLISRAAVEKDADLIRICHEYLPLTFSRRHGDPSRPWNIFSIETKNEDGSKLLSYQGNWRDIFQNWEALCFSFPEYIESIICKFVNASTADGYNPYRITRNGFEWEVLDPSDPWSNIGYWGDHQIIYLLKFLEISRQYHPGILTELLKKDLFVYANIPYRIKPYEELIDNPHDTISFDYESEKRITEKVSTIGSDGKLIWSKNGRLYHVNLTEKLLISLLSKLTNFIPEAGIWMNTQRPEWNDANNALVGYGVSMVTLYYIRRYLSFCIDLFNSVHEEQVRVSMEVAGLLKNVSTIFKQHMPDGKRKINDKDRKVLLDQLGRAGSIYRKTIYDTGFSGTKKNITVKSILNFLNITLRHIDHSLTANKRRDRLYHAYNLMDVKSDREIAIRYLYEMLEGQVAVLSSGFLSLKESVALLEALEKSSLFRKDQHSYILYPNRNLPRFLEKNNIPPSMIKRSKLLQKLIREGDKQIVIKDKNNRFHFNGSFRNAGMLKEALNRFNNTKYEDLAGREKKLVLEMYETVFDHQSFTGRSGTFFAYEGLGSIYWHMVSKLLLAVEEIYYRHIQTEKDRPLLAKLKKQYYEIRAGLGLNKSPAEYGAFPTDPYSHTPAHAGAQQPGLTGQVKEDIISRWAELGLRVQQGKITFSTALLRNAEFLKSGSTFIWYAIDGSMQTIQLPKNSLVFTFCQVPVIYHRSNKNRLIVTKQDDTKINSDILAIEELFSKSIFERHGLIRQIDVFFNLK